MDYMLFDSAGNAIDAFTDEADAHAALRDVLRQEPGTMRDVALLIFDDDGDAVGDVRVAAEPEPDLAVEIQLVGTSWVRWATTFTNWDVTIPSALQTWEPNA